MHESDAQYASDRLTQFQKEFQLDLIPDWGGGSTRASGPWQEGSWIREELDRLHDTVLLFANEVGGRDKLIQCLGGVRLEKSDIGSHAGRAVAHKVVLAKKSRFTPWTVIHEMAHAWDANYGWNLSRLLERYTGGFTSLLWSRIRKRIRSRDWDAGPNGKENVPGRYGRKPGSNRAGYFYGDKPSGSNWNFNRKEDFAEAVAMYFGWGKDNVLSDQAQKRIMRYSTYKNGEKDGFGVADNWEDYAVYFYPENGDYTRTKRWKFIDDLVKGQIPK